LWKGDAPYSLQFRGFQCTAVEKTAQDDKESSPFDEDESNSDNGNLSGKGLLINGSQLVEVQSLSATIFETIIGFFRDMEVADEYRSSGASSSPISGNRTSQQNEPTSTSDRHDETGLGLRRTPSGMFLPIEEVEDSFMAAVLSTGLLMVWIR
jgi:hypothetical protein